MCEQLIITDKVISASIMSYLSVSTHEYVCVHMDVTHIENIHVNMHVDLPQ